MPLLNLIDPRDNTIRVIFRNINRDGKLNGGRMDKRLKTLNFVYVDVKLNFEKVDELSDQDIALMKKIDEEKEQKQIMKNKNAKSKKVETASDNGVPEIRAVKIYK